MEWNVTGQECTSQHVEKQCATVIMFIYHHVLNSVVLYMIQAPHHSHASTSTTYQLMIYDEDNQCVKQTMAWRVYLKWRSGLQGFSRSPLFITFLTIARTDRDLSKKGSFRSSFQHISPSCNISSSQHGTPVLVSLTAQDRLDLVFFFDLTILRSMGRRDHKSQTGHQ